MNHRRAGSTRLQRVCALLWLGWLLMCAPRAAEFDFVPPRFETIDTSEVIPEAVITALVQDTQGFVWIGTQNGLVRYDGYKQRSFIHDTANAHSLPGDNVLSLLAARDGRVWVGTVSDGLAIFDPASEQFEHFSHDEQKPDSLSGGRIWAMVEDGKGGVWLATDQGLDYVMAHGRTFRHVRHMAGRDRSLRADKTSALLIDRTGRLWVGGSSGLQRLAENGQDFDLSLLPGSNIQALFQAKDGKLWVGTLEQGAAWVEPDRWLVHWVSPAEADSSGSAKRISGIAQTPDGQIWLASYGAGLLLANGSDGHIVQHVRYDATQREGLAHDTVVPLLLDRSGLLWIGTWGGGLQRVNSHNTMARMLRHRPDSVAGLSYHDVTSVLELADGRILFGLDRNGIDIVDPGRGRVGGYRSGKGGLPQEIIRALAQSPDGTVWVGMRDAGVVRLRPGQNRWESVAGLPASQVKSMLAARDGSVWAGTAQGAARWDGHAMQGGMPQFVAIPDETGKPMEYRVQVLAEDAMGRVWAGSENGLWRWQPGHRGMQGIHPEPGRASSIVSDYITSLLFDAHGGVWVGTDKGIEHLLREHGTVLEFEHVEARLGQPGKDMGGSLLEDQSGRIWTESAVIDPAHWTFELLGKGDGLDIGTGWIGSFGKTRRGLLIYGGPHGAALVDPTRFVPWREAPPLVISAVSVNGVAVAPGGLAGAGPRQLTLQPEQRDFAIEFAALDYSDPNKNRYQYRLQGYDKDWINGDAQHRTASYGNLWPGSYTLLIRGSNRLGQWSGHELSIGIRVLPAFWQTAWFLALMLLAGGACLVAAHRWRVRRLRMQARELQGRIDARVADILQIGQIGQELTATLDVDHAFERVYSQVRARLDSDVFLIGQYDGSRQRIVVLHEMAGGVPCPPTTLDMADVHHPAVCCVREKRAITSTRREELPPEVAARLAPAMQTVVYLPLMLEHYVIGCLSVQSAQVAAYRPEQIEFLRILASYAAIALSNAIAHSDLAASHGELASALRQVQEAQARLVQAEKMAALGGLVVGIAHEINTPLGNALTALSGAADVWQALNQAVQSHQVSKAALVAHAEAGLEYTGLALRNATRAAELVRSFKSIAVHQGVDQPVALALAPFLQDQADLLRPALEAIGCGVTVAVPPNLICQVAPDALAQALHPVLANVLDHAFADGRHGTLAITAHAEAHGSIVIEVADDGKGIAASDLPKVFDPFFSTQSGTGGHVGLGLHVAFNQVAERLGGDISIDSTLGAGTVVRIRLGAPSPA